MIGTSRESLNRTSQAHAQFNFDSGRRASIDLQHNNLIRFGRWMLEDEKLAELERAAMKRREFKDEAQLQIERAAIQRQRNREQDRLDAEEIKNYNPWGADARWRASHQGRVAAPIEARDLDGIGLLTVELKDGYAIEDDPFRDPAGKRSRWKKAHSEPLTDSKEFTDKWYGRGDEKAGLNHKRTILNDWAEVGAEPSIQFTNKTHDHRELAAEHKGPFITPIGIKEGNGLGDDPFRDLTGRTRLKPGEQLPGSKEFIDRLALPLRIHAQRSSLYIYVLTILLDDRGWPGGWGTTTIRLQTTVAKFPPTGTNLDRSHYHGTNRRLEAVL